MAKHYWKTVYDIAAAEVGYKEKATNANLDSKTANAAKANNYTKYARDVAKTDLLNGNKNGFYWCAVFVIWCFFKAFGVEDTHNLLHLPVKSCGAGVDWLRRYFKDAGALYNKPKVGDIVFFGTQHTGLVVGVNGNTITTIEGNTSNGVGVNPNGDGVYRRTRTVDASMTFGRPKYDAEAVSKSDTPTTKQPIVDRATNFSGAYDKTFTVTAKNALNVRAGAGTSKAKLGTFRHGAKVRCYGYYTKVGDTAWLYVTDGKLTGFCSGKYLK